MRKGVKKGKKGGFKKTQARRATVEEKEESEISENELEQTPGVSMMQQREVENLTKAQLDEFKTKFLTTTNPQAAHNITVYQYKDHSFKKDDIQDHLMIHFSMDGNILLHDSEEAKDMEDMRDMKGIENAKLIKKMNEGITDDQGEPIKQDDTDLKKSLRNQFNFQERAAQTFNNSIRQRGISTSPPNISVFHREATQWRIFDDFMEYFESERQKSGEEEKASAKTLSRSVREDPLYGKSMANNLKIMLRVVLQNFHEDRFRDYKYYDDVSDAATDSHHGTALPLWRYLAEKSKRKEVTAIAWNPKYKDLFAVGYGTYTFAKKTSSGVISCFTLKNPKYPEFIFTTDSDVMCLDWNPTDPALLVVGTYDGTVLVFDVRANEKENKVKNPIYQSTVRTRKHTDPVWQVIWQPADLGKQLAFNSISSDGRVTTWTLMKNKLEAEDVIRLKLVPSADKEEAGANYEEEESVLVGYAGGMCFDFNKSNEHLFLVGTEEGRIHLCSKAYSGQYLETYEGHILAVYAVKWNYFHPRVFLSCSADWTIKMWDQNCKTPIATFDLPLCGSINDIQWAPYSATVFAAVTADAKLLVYDLAVEKHTYLCDQKIVKKTKLTHVAFNPVDPIILIGDERGGATCLRLSPNLRGALKANVGKNLKDIEANKIDSNLEKEKMDKFLAMQDKELY